MGTYEVNGRNPDTRMLVISRKSKLTSILSDFKLRRKTNTPNISKSQATHDLILCNMRAYEANGSNPSTRILTISGFFIFFRIKLLECIVVNRFTYLRKVFYPHEGQKSHCILKCKRQTGRHVHPPTERLCYILYT